MAEKRVAGNSQTNGAARRAERQGARPMRSGWAAWRVNARGLEGAGSLVAVIEAALR